MRRILCALLPLFPLFLAPSVASAADLTIKFRVLTDGAITNSNVVVGNWTTTGNPILPKPTITVNGITAAVNTVDLTFTAVIPLAQGPATVVANMVAGVDTASAQIGITFDNVAPTLSIDAPSDASTTGFRSVKVTGEAHNDPNDADPNTLTVTANFSQTPLLTAPGEFSQSVSLNPGLSTIIVTATDRAGNSTQQQVTITRTIVCQDPNWPIPNASDPNAPQTYVVDRSDDLADPDPTDDKCDVRPDLRDPDPNDPNAPFTPPIGHCTLRAAIQTANHHPGDDQIYIGNRILVLRRTGPGEDLAATGDLDITDNLRIFGGGRDSAVIDARKLGDRVFDVAPGVKLVLERLTVEGGRTAKPATPPEDPNDAERGGCIRSRGPLLMNTVAVLECKADGPGGGISLEDPNDPSKFTCSIVARAQSKLDGGGIAFEGSELELRDSTLSLDSAGRLGGALFGAGAKLTLANVTVSHNKSKLAGGALALGDGAQATVNNCTFSDNGAKLGATFTTTGSASLSVSNSILGDGSRSACDPTSPEPIVSLGGNLDRGESCHLSRSDDLENVDPKLNRLATNGGPPTQSLRSDSPAIDFAGRTTACEALDARDADRGDWPGNGTGDQSLGHDASPPFCDSGAFELRVPAN
ncbi:MAG: choice-of-anchor Q domain-containing protein [Myxococcota bacterium]